MACNFKNSTDILKLNEPLLALCCVAQVQQQKEVSQTVHIWTLWHLTLNNLCSFVFSNTKRIVSLLGNGIEESLIPHHINLTQGSKITTEDYQQMIGIIQKVKENDFKNLGLESCTIEDELNKVPEKL